MTSQEVLKRIRRIRVMPLFYKGDPETSIRVMKAIFDGGLELLEFTNRGENALKVFRELMAYKKEHYPNALLGIGSIIDADTADSFIKEGADFVVSPLLKKEVIEKCLAEGILSIPGATTLTEIHQAETWGAEMVKVFPGSLLGPAYIKAIKGPCPWLSLTVTGGVEPTEENLKAWHEAGAEAFGMGSKLLSNELINKGDFDGLTAKVRGLVEIVSRLS